MRRRSGPASAVVWFRRRPRWCWTPKTGPASSVGRITGSASGNGVTETIAEAAGDWFFDRREVKELDCEYPCNSTCHNLVFDKPFKG
ncbi:hypothetical protein BRADI_2g38823v3 [Brachypodium distachyon]|uniref:Pectin acetylesterase n=1 Tax=Brachypodium distachyon TaxID=15368 RepID=A0A2K2DCP4_BRADI|nr:hypothetical protein BRADI_2g38823v3 [Brachypodium distachyon]